MAPRSKHQSPKHLAQSDAEVPAEPIEDFEPVAEVPADEPIAEEPQAVVLETAPKPKAKLSANAELVVAVEALIAYAARRGSSNTAEIVAVKNALANFKA